VKSSSSGRTPCHGPFSGHFQPPLTLSQYITVSCTRNGHSHLEHAALLPMLQPRTFLLVPRSGSDCLVGARSRLTGIGRLVTCREGCWNVAHSRFGIDAKNCACREGGTDAAVGEGVVQFHPRRPRLHLVFIVPWTAIARRQCWTAEKQNAGQKAETSMKRGESHTKKRKEGRHTEIVCNASSTSEEASLNTRDVPTNDYPRYGKEWASTTGVSMGA
jgi:hypothetical protein